MNYPLWHLPTLGGGTLIAPIAIGQIFVSYLAVGGSLLLVLILLYGLWQPSRTGRPLTVLALAAALLAMGSLEWSREVARRPFVNQQASFSNDISPDRVRRLQEQGFLEAFFSGSLFQPPQPSSVNRQKRDSDQLLFEQNCTLCHPRELVRKRTAGWSREHIRRTLDNLNLLNPAMPDYRGTPQEKDRLADYILQLNRRPHRPSPN